MLSIAPCEAERVVRTGRVCMRIWVVYAVEGEVVSCMYENVGERTGVVTCASLLFCRGGEASIALRYWYCYLHWK